MKCQKPLIMMLILGRWFICLMPGTCGALLLLADVVCFYSSQFNAGQLGARDQALDLTCFRDYIIHSANLLQHFKLPIVATATATLELLALSDHYRLGTHNITFHSRDTTASTRQHVVHVRQDEGRDGLRGEFCQGRDGQQEGYHSRSHSSHRRVLRRHQ